MADILDVISSRQSIRKYTDEPIPEEMIDKIIEAARWAPSGENEQPWELVIVRDPETRNKIGDFCKIGTGQRGTAEHCLGEDERFDVYTDPAERARVAEFYYSGLVSFFPANAPLVIVVIGSLKGMMDTPYDLSACIENMILEAHALGLGACWVHGPAVYPRIVKQIKEFLGIPSGMGDYKMLAIVSIGWPSGRRSHPQGRKDASEFVHWEKFGNRERV
jgi:nitroreductase